MSGERHATPTDVIRGYAHAHAIFAATQPRARHAFDYSSAMPLPIMRDILPPPSSCAAVKRRQPAGYKGNRQAGAASARMHRQIHQKVGNYPRPIVAGAW